MIALVILAQIGSFEFVAPPPPPSVANYSYSCIVYGQSARRSVLSGAFRSLDRAGTELLGSLTSADASYPSVAELKVNYYSPTLFFDGQLDRTYYRFVLPQVGDENGYVAISYVKNRSLPKASAKYVGTGICTFSNLVPSK